MTEQPRKVSVPLDSLSPQMQAILTGGVVDRLTAPHFALVVKQRVPNEPAYREPKGWRRFSPLHHYLAVRAHRRATEAWVAAGCPDLEVVRYIPRAIFVPTPKEPTDG